MINVQNISLHGANNKICTTKITKEFIIDVVQRFEQQKDLQLSDRKKLPTHLGFGETFSAIDVNTFKTDTTVAKYAQEQKPTFHNKQRSTSRDSGNFRSGSSTPGTLTSSRSRERSAGGQQHTNKRQGSRSPGPNTHRSSSGSFQQRSAQSPRTEETIS